MTTQRPFIYMPDSHLKMRLDIANRVTKNGTLPIPPKLKRRYELLIIERANRN